MPQKAQTKVEVGRKTNSLERACTTIPHIKTQDDLLVNEVVEIVEVANDGNSFVPSPVILRPVIFQ